MAGGLLAALGIVVLVVAIFALRNPRNTGTSPGSTTRTVTVSSSASASAPAGSSGPSGSSRSSATSSSARTSARTSAGSSSVASASGLRGALPLVVVNTVGTPGLATAAATQFRSGGWQVSSLVDDARSDILSSAAYYDPAVSNAQQVAQSLQRQFPAIKRVAPKFGGLPSGPIVVLLTSDYSTG